MRAALGPKARHKLVPVFLFSLISLHAMSPSLSGTHCHGELSVSVKDCPSFLYMFVLKRPIY